jgi:hypothetical protein
VIGLLAVTVTANLKGAKQKATIAKGQTFSSSIQQKIGADLVGAWDFDEGAGTTAKDSSGMNNNGTLVNGPVWMTNKADCISGNCLSFDGVNDYIPLGTSSSLIPGLKSLTVGGWIFPHDYTYPKSRFPIGGYTGSSSGLPMWYVDASYNSNGTVIGFSDGINRISGVLVCDVGYRPNDTRDKWTNIYIVFDRDAGKVYEYINGIKQTNTIDISSVTRYVINPYNNISNIAGWMFDGSIDEVRIYNTSLSAHIIKDNYLFGLKKMLLNKKISEYNYWQKLKNFNKEYADAK